MAVPPAGPSGAVETAAELAVELQRFAAYLAGASPTAHQIEKYIDFHRRHPLAAKSRFDRLLMSAARSGGIGLSLADSYSGLLARRSLLRAKLIVALAILECSAPSFAVLDAPDPGGRRVYFNAALRGAASVLAFSCAALFLIPAQLWCAVTGRER